MKKIATPIFLLPLLLALATSNVYADTESNLEFCYDFEGDRVDAINNISLIVDGQAAFDDNGVIGQANHFVAGNNMQNTTISAIMTGNPDFTVAGWFKTNGSLCQSGDSSPTRYLIGYGNINNVANETLGFACTDEEELQFDLRCSGVAPVVTPGFSPNGAEFVMAGAVYHSSNNTVDLYIDGVKVNSSSVNCLANFPAGSDVIINNHDTNPANSYVGLTDMPSLWTRSLTAQDMAEYYNAGNGLSCAATSNTAPTQPVIHSPTTPSQEGDLLLNATSGDINNDTITYHWFENDVLRASITSPSTLLFGVDTYNVSVYATDGFVNTANTSFLLTTTKAPFLDRELSTEDIQQGVFNILGESTLSFTTAITLVVIALTAMFVIATAGIAIRRLRRL